MTLLALTLPVSRFETPTDYLSRLAARNLSPDLWNFSQDTGLDFSALSTGDSASVAHLCSLAGIPADSFAGRTVIKTSSMKYRLGAEVLNTETLSRGDIRFCPACVAGAIAAGVPPWDVIHELHWQFIHIRRCWQHGVPLQRWQGWKVKTDPFSRFDFTAALREIGPHIHPKWHEPEEKPDALDLYLTKRAYGEHRENWCNRLELPALIKASEAFGVLIDHGRDMRASSLADGQRRDAMLTGFQILGRGPDGIWQALDGFNRRTPTRGGNQPHPSNGEVQRLLGSHGKMRANLEPVREVVREYFLDHYPFRAGTTVLGVKVKESRVVSIRGACREIGIRRSLLEEILIRRGDAHRDAGEQFHLDRVLSKSFVADIRQEKQDYLDQQQTAKFLGCSFAMFKQLQNTGVLHPAEGGGRRQRKGFHRPALQALLDRLGADTRFLRRSPPDCCTMELATRKANCGVPTIVRLMLSGKLSAAGRLSANLRLDSLLIDTSALIRALSVNRPNGHSSIDLQSRLFANRRTLDWLIGQGYLEVRRMRHSLSRVTRDYITAESFAQFEKDHITIGQIARQKAMRLHLVKRGLSLEGAMPLTTEAGLRAIYRRNDLPAAFRG